ncbi:MAG: nucleoside hydrolase [Azospirillaceae bacterium]
MAPAVQPRRIIIDCDPGIDDAIALLLAFASPELELRGITVVSGNVSIDLTVRNTLQICALAGESGVAVHAGCHRPLVREPIRGLFSGPTGLGKLDLTAPTRPPAGRHAVAFLVEALTAAAEEGAPITVCTMGPLTNLAVALRINPKIAAGIERVVMMGGAYQVPGNRTPAAEFNILADPHAAHIVFSSGLPITAIGLDASHQALSTPERVAMIEAVGGALGRTVGDLLRFWDRGDPARFAGPGGPLHDPLVIAHLLRPQAFATRAAAVAVELEGALTLGQTVPDWYGQTGAAASVDVVTEVDADAFYGLLAERLAAGRRRVVA